jgi:hypothetical protein
MYEKHYISMKNQAKILIGIPNNIFSMGEGTIKFLFHNFELGKKQGLNLNDSGTVTRFSIIVVHI